MSTHTNHVVFQILPPTLRKELLGEYGKIEQNYRENRWEPAELDGGKFSEVVYCIVEGYLTGTYPVRATKPNNFAHSCTNHIPGIQTNAVYGLDSMRLTIPRVLMALYDIRNRRSVGHVGGDVDPNHMDATLVLSMAKWVMAELVRVLHQLDVETATHIVETLTERILPYVWEVDGVKRVLVTGMKKGDQILHLMYATTRPVSVKELSEWTTTRSDNLKKVLVRMHKENLLHYNQSTNMVTLSAIGVLEVEKQNTPLLT